MKKKTLLAWALGLGLALGASAQAQETRDLKFSLWVPPGHPMVADLKKWAQSLSDDSGGTLKATIYPAAQLGRAQDHYDMARDGIVDMAMVAPGYSPGRFPIWTLIELPFTVSNAVGGAQGLHEWYSKYAAKEMPDVKICMVSMHHPGIIHTKSRQIGMPSDIKGLRLRPAGPITAQWISELGGANVQAALPELRELAERGVIDGTTFAWDILVVGAEQSLKKHMDEELYTTAQVYVINKNSYNSLSAQQKKVLDSHCTPEWSARVGAGWAKQELAARDKLKSMPGHVVYKLTPEQRAAWHESAKPLSKAAYDAVQKRYQLDGAALHKELIEALARHDAAVKAP